MMETIRNDLGDGSRNTTTPLSQLPQSQDPTRLTANTRFLVKRVKKKEESNLKVVGDWFFENQIGLSFNLIALLFLSHILIPKSRTYTSKFFTLSHYNTSTGKYASSSDDFCFISFCVILITGLRAACMEYILSPLANHWGIPRKKEATRFAEQAWLWIYALTVWPIGFYIYYNSPCLFNMDELWTNWPDRELDGFMKAYVMVQWSFWIQQILVVHIEDRRKDHWQMLTHHFITVTLVSASYAYHQTRVGSLILWLMDVVDLTFPLAKCFKYLGYTTICNILFGLFMTSFFIARHVIFLVICWSIYTDIPRLITPGCYHGNMNDLHGPLPVPNNWSHVFQPFHNPDGIVCWNDNIMHAFLGTLLVLQVITAIWFVAIVRVAVKVCRGGSAEDIRSDDEGEEEEEAEIEYEELPPLEEEVGVEDINLVGWERRSATKRGAHASGVTISSTRKELLNRVGCKDQIE